MLCYSEAGYGAVIQYVPDSPISLTNDASITDAYTIRFTWTQGLSNGGTDVIDYYDQGLSSDYVLLQQGVTNTYYSTTTTLTPGVTYSFKVTARNTVGSSLQSSTISIIAAKIPDAPLYLVNNAAVTTAYQIGLTWSAGTYNGGSPVLDYQVSYAEASSSVYSVYASGITTTSTTVTNLTPGVTYLFKLKAQNVVGYSDYSAEISVLAAQVPDSPISLMNDATVTNAIQIRFIWSDGVFNGGTHIIDYSIYYDEGLSNDYVLLQSGVTNQYFTTTTTLTPGVTYQFKVSARNLVGSSLQSSAIAIVAAKIPDSPLSLANNAAVTTAYQIGLTWSAGTYNGGSPVFDYQVSYAEASSSVYSVYASGIITTLTTVTNLTPGVTYLFKVKAKNVVGFSDYPAEISVLAAQISDPPTSLANVFSVTSASQIGLTWSAPNFQGGSSVIDYRLLTDNASGSTFTVLADGLTSLSYTAIQLTCGLTYQFKVQAQNAYVYSTYSNVVSILAAQVPAQPLAPTTTWSPDNVIVTWSAPDSGGSPITGYSVSIIQSDAATYSTELTNCDRSSSNSTTCTIPVTVLRASLFSLDWGTSVYAKVFATNIYGDSVQSSAGNGAVITTTPDAPINLVENTSLRTKSTIGLTWSKADFIGGAEIIDYRVNYAQSGGSYSVLASNIASPLYTAIELTAGVTYQFKIESRNSYGYSTYSSIISLLCAYVPDPPTSVTTANSAEKVTITWSSPITNGSPITAYKIYIRQSDMSTYTQQQSECDGTSIAVMSSRTCSVSLTTLRASPYSLVKGDDVYVKIISVNLYGDSATYSDAGYGAVIQYVPNAPILLTNDASTTSDSVIRFTWSEGISNGGTSVIDFSVYYDQGTNMFTLLDSGVTVASYTTKITLISGVTYSFKVTARNSVGISEYSDTLSILAATIPDAPLTLTNNQAITTAYQVGLTWSATTYNGGSPVIDYRVSYAVDSSSTYTIFASGITTASTTVTNLTPGVTYKFVVQQRNIYGFSVYSSSISVLAAQISDPPTSLANVVAITAASQIGLTWLAPEFQGGSSVINYRLWTDNASGSTFTILADGLTSLSYTATSLTQGSTYQFKVQAYNAYGYSTFSNVVSILSAQVPAQPSAPITTWSPDNVIITWSAPDNGGSPIIGYSVSLIQSDALTYSTELTSCDQSSSTATTCTIPVTVLRASPFSLDWGTSVYAKVIATNIYGNSVQSTAGNGAVITTTPDAPINLAENTSLRTKSTIGLTWSKADFIGGAEIIDYRVNYAQSGGSYSVLASNIASPLYTAIELTAGVTYDFKIESRNSYGYSTYSSSISLLCAYVPDPPTTVATANSANQVTITWSSPVTNGSPITAYKIFIRQKDGTTYTQESVECDGTQTSVVSSRTCSVSLTTLRATPYSLVKDDSVYVKIISANVYGDSATYSEPGFGAVIQYVPDAPISLTNDASTTIDTLIRFTWSQGISNGGTSVIDYTVYYDQGTSEYIQLASGVTNAYYSTSVTLIPGTTYSFKVTARNSVGSSVQSDSLQVLAAKVPDAPLALANNAIITTAYQIGLTWSAGAYNGGIDVLDYQVSYAEQSNSVYTVYANTISTTSTTVTNLTPGVTYLFKVKARNVVGLSDYSIQISVLAAQISDQPTSLANVASVTSASQIGLTWLAPAFQGGSSVTDYRLWTDDASGSTFTILADGLTSLSYTATSLTQGSTYQFKVQAHNAYGQSTFSNVVSILAAQVPAQPSAPTTMWSPDNVIVTWSAPDSGGSPITGYTISLIQSDAVTYSTELTNCDQTSSTSTTCTIPVIVLRASPFNLAWGTSVYAKVIATNIYGNSVQSSAGNGAVITTTPDAPINLAENTSLRTKSTIGLTWSKADFIGGADILDYRVNYAQSGGSYSVLASNIASPLYTAIDLTAGVTYEFKIESRNSYGYSTFSSSISLLCAFVPDPPTTVTTENSANKVIITWSSPITNGSPITYFKIYIRQSDMLTYTQSSECDGTQSTVMSSRTCSVFLTTLRASPYSLVKDDGVYVKIISVNLYGDSIYSDAGSGALIQYVPDAPINLLNDASITDYTKIGLTWSAGASNGGTSLIDYNLYYALSSETYLQLVTGLTLTSYTTTQTLTAGQNYKFMVQSRNSVGYSQNSTEVIVMAARVPDVPSVTTEISSSNVLITWTWSHNGGSAITSYTVIIQQSDGVTFTEDTANCNGSSSSVLTAQSCLVPITVLRSSPYSLAWGSSIFAKVKSTNIVGSSAYSTAGNGAIITTFPDPPINLANQPSQTSSVKIGVQWSDGLSNGGATVVSYKVLYAISATAPYLIAGYPTTQSTVIFNLLAGTTYFIKVQSKNSFGYSSDSSIIQILAASRPNTPAAPTTTFSNSAVKISWNAPASNGAAISAYTILIRQTDKVTFSTELSYCNGSSLSVISALSCTIPLSVLQAAPFNLKSTQSVFARLSATNSAGTSANSSAGNGAVLP